MTPAAHLDTVAVHAGRDDLAGLGVHVPPIDLSTTNPLPDVDLGGASYETLATGGTPQDGDSMVYQRLWNPTVARFERALATLEGTEEAVAFSSGMAALSACVLAVANTGRRHIVAIRPLYGGSDHLLATGLFGTEVSWVDAARPDRVGDAIRADTGLVIAETPTNPTLELIDLDLLATACGPVPLLVDNTFATPVLQNPARHGAALVLHSATKFLGGHGDVLAGAVATTGVWAARLRQVRAVTGGILHPLAGYLLHRGLQTLPVRMRAQQDGASKLAAWLAEHPAVAAVHYPGLPENDPHRLVGRQQAGPGSVLSMRVRGGYQAAAAIANRCALITHAVSLGGTDTLIQHPASLTHRPVSDEAKPDAGLLRVSVGLESPDDLITDLAAAMS